MEWYKTVTEAIEICRNTYHGRTYELIEENTGEILTGTAVEIYGELTLRRLMGDDERDFCPVHDDSVEDWAFVETMCAIEDTPPMTYSWQFAALDLLNQMVEEAEGN